MPHNGPRSAWQAPRPSLASACVWETLRYTYAWIFLISPQRQLYLAISRSQKSSVARSIDFWKDFRQSQMWFMMMHIIDHLRRYLAIQNKKTRVLIMLMVWGARPRGERVEDTVHFTGEVISTSEKQQASSPLSSPSCYAGWVALPRC